MTTSLLQELEFLNQVLQCERKQKTHDVTLLAVYLTAQGRSHSELKPYSENPSAHQHTVMPTYLLTMFSVPALAVPTSCSNKTKSPYLKK